MNLLWVYYKHFKIPWSVLIKMLSGTSLYYGSCKNDFPSIILHPKSAEKKKVYLVFCYLISVLMCFINGIEYFCMCLLVSYMSSLLVYVFRSFAQLYFFTDMGRRWHTHTTIHAWRMEENLWEFLFSLYNMSLGDQTQVIKLSRKPLCPLSYWFPFAYF